MGYDVLELLTEMESGAINICLAPGDQDEAGEIVCSGRISSICQYCETPEEVALWGAFWEAYGDDLIDMGKCSDNNWRIPYVITSKGEGRLVDASKQ